MGIVRRVVCEVNLAAAILIHNVDLIIASAIAVECDCGKRQRNNRGSGLRGGWSRSAGDGGRRGRDAVEAAIAEGAAGLQAVRTMIIVIEPTLRSLFICAFSVEP